MSIINIFRKKKEKPKYQVTKKYLFFKFTGGLFSGLGTVVGATILVAFFVFLLSQLKLIPILGDFAEKIVDVIKEKTD